MKARRFSHPRLWSQRRLWLLAFGALQLVALWQGFGEWLFRAGQFDGR